MARPSIFKTTKPSSSSSSRTDITDLVRKKAYELWEKRGRASGHALEDWLEAERIVKGKAK